MHWRPQVVFCQFQLYSDLFSFVGNFENLESHARLLLKSTDLWESFGSHGWGPNNESMFQKNQASHKTSSSSRNVNDFLPPTSTRRRAVFNYYRKDFEILSKITTPPFDPTPFLEEIRLMESVWGANAQLL
mmetsp:Transcript_7178/g.20761  ORF Transcript_7178/g.20761 Transcript_7178/m.20761 type:complete len:131 (-) Transcript_7178:136-528(-)